jgi:hypothetical protein
MGRLKQYKEADVRPACCGLGTTIEPPAGEEESCTFPDCKDQAKHTFLRYSYFRPLQSRREDT